MALTLNPNPALTPKVLVLMLILFYYRLLQRKQFLLLMDNSKHMAVALQEKVRIERRPVPLP